MSEHGYSLVLMSDTITRASITVSINAGSDMSTGDAESLATKFMEVVLRDCGVTWGPGIRRDVLSFGPRSVYSTLEPQLLVEVQTFVEAYCSVATVEISDSELGEEIYTASEAIAQAFQLDAVSVVAGRSHPHDGHMVEHEDLRQFRRDQFRQQWNTHSWIRQRGHETLITDEDGNLLDVSEQPRLAYTSRRDEESQA